MSSLRPRSVHAPRRSWLLGLLVCACLLAQTLGLVHRVQHGGRSAPEALAVASAPQADAHPHLFAGHARATDCQLYDHLGLAELLATAPLPALATVHAALAVARLPAGIAARLALAFQARAPPVLR